MSPLPRIPRSADDDCAPPIVAERRRLAERSAGRELAHLAGRAVDPAQARGNVENSIGFAQVPVGLAGPLLVHASSGAREVYVPMATNEGALVASYSRGMRVTSAAGGVRARVVREALTQHPMLVYAGVEEALRAAQIARAAFEEFAALTSAGSRHGRLVALDTRVIGNRLVLELSFTTGDAIGINMAALASERISEQLARRSAARERYVHGQDVEKRANAYALARGRGRSVVAEATIARQLLAEQLRVSPEQLRAIQAAYAAGFAQLGTHNWLVQSANGLAAVMLACGQDVAYLPECATGYLEFQVTPEGALYAAATLPSLLVGTVGGGSQKGTAAECLSILGCAGAGHANTFAEILGAVVLAGELSLMASFCTHEFTAAHERLGRNRPSDVV
ncbi:MAG: 3-hydroxy-3-methylglutaryl-CoA reductase [Planctomycetes bacterium]|nr:3-hydroxy-3-methylglutaryl-CoA reductase [Planctomycetota bacterium]